MVTIFKFKSVIKGKCIHKRESNRFTVTFVILAPEDPGKEMYAENNAVKGQNEDILAAILNL